MKFMLGLQHPLTCKPWNKARGEYFSKKVFLRLPSCVLHSCVFLRASVSICESLWYGKWVYNSITRPEIEPRSSRPTNSPYAIINLFQQSTDVDYFFRWLLTKCKEKWNEQYLWMSQKKKKKRSKANEKIEMPKRPTQNTLWNIKENLDQSFSLFPNFGF